MADLQLINDLGYNPSYPYGSANSGVPTQTGAGLGGNLVGAILGNLLLPGFGGLIGAKLGGMAGRGLARSFQGPGQQLNQAPGQPAANNKGGGGGQVSQPAVTQAPAQPAANNKGGGPAAAGSGAGFTNDPGSTYNYLEHLGYEPGQGNASLWPGAGPSVGAFDVGAYGVGGGGGSFFHDLGGRGGPLPGSFAGLGSFDSGNLGQFGNTIGMHTQGFRDYYQGLGYQNLNDYMKGVGLAQVSGVGRMGKTLPGARGARGLNQT